MTTRDPVPITSPGLLGVTHPPAPALIVPELVDKALPDPDPTAVHKVLVAARGSIFTAIAKATIAHGAKT
jgi:hypothetical protein